MRQIVENRDAQIRDLNFRISELEQEVTALKKLDERVVWCTSCDENGEHYHWIGEPFMPNSAAFRGHCTSCNGLKRWKITYSTDLMPQVKTWGWGALLRLGSKLSRDTIWYPNPTQRFVQSALLDAINRCLRYDHGMSDDVRFQWYRRIHEAERQRMICTP